MHSGSPTIPYVTMPQSRMPYITVPPANIPRIMVPKITTPKITTMQDIVSRYGIPQNDSEVLVLNDTLAVITSRQYFMNVFTNSEWYLPSIKFWENGVAVITENSKTILQLVSKIPSKSRIRILSLEMELTHMSLLILDYQHHVFYTIDPVCGCSCYTFMDAYIVPLLTKILGTEWRYDTSSMRSATCKGPQCKTQDDYCYLWSLLISDALTNNVVNPDAFFADLQNLSSADLSSVITRFTAYLYQVLLRDGSLAIFQMINANENNFCYHVIDYFTDTVCSVKYNNQLISGKELLERTLDEVENIKMGCEVKNISQKS